MVKAFHIAIISVLILTLTRNVFEQSSSSKNTAWQSSCEESLQRAEAALQSPARPTQVAQRVRDLPNEYRKARTRDVVHFIVSNWSAREDLQSAFSNESGELDSGAMEAMVRWTRDGVDSTAVALVPCANELSQLPGAPSEQSAIPEIIRWARARVRWQPEVDNAAYVAADFIRNDPVAVKAARLKPSTAILAAASVSPEDPRYESLWAYQSMFDLLLQTQH
jgi:hypothetical protein